MDGRQLWWSRALESWQALERAGVRRRAGRVTVKEPGGLRAVPLWPFSQVFHAATVLSESHVIPRSHAHDLLTTLQTYRAGLAYAERPSNQRRYFDDNAWIALAAIDYDTQESLAIASRIYEFLRQGSDVCGPAEIGVRWVESGRNHHSCSTGSTGLVAIRLAVTGVIPGEPALEFAQGCANFLVALQDSDGLVRDHRRPDGGIDAGIYTYNQGLTLGLLAAVGRQEEAVALANRTIEMFDGERFWKHAPAFNSIFIRELMRLHQVAPHPHWLEFSIGYLDRAWTQARLPDSGLLRGGGIGAYDKDVLLDHAGLTHAMFAIGVALDRS
jgi:hypothetical protein